MINFQRSYDLPFANNPNHRGYEVCSRFVIWLRCCYSDTSTQTQIWYNTSTTSSLFNNRISASRTVQLQAAVDDALVYTLKKQQDLAGADQA